MEYEARTLHRLHGWNETQCLEDATEDLPRADTAVSRVLEGLREQTLMDRKIMLTTALPPEETNLSKTESKREGTIYEVSYPFVVSWVS